MKDQLISFNTAKLAKEKGFDGLSYAHYSRKGILTIQEHPESEQFLQYVRGNTTLSISAPTQSVLQKYLRDIHDIHIMIEPLIDPDDKSTFYEMIVITDMSENEKNEKIEGEHFDTYEEALEEGLQEGLKLIVNE